MEKDKIGNNRKQKITENRKGQNIKQQETGHIQEIENNKMKKTTGNRKEQNREQQKTGNNSN